MMTTFYVEIKETRIEYSVVEVDAPDADEALSIASERYEVDENSSSSFLGQLDRRYVDIVSVSES